LAVSISPTGNAVMAAARGTGYISRAATPPCSEADLVVWLDTNAKAGAGTAYFPLELTNVSDRSCRLLDQLRVVAIGQSGQIGAAATSSPASPRSPLSLASRATATVTLGISAASNYPPSICNPEVADALRIALPAPAGLHVVPFPFLACRRDQAAILTLGHIARTTQVLTWW
jgi:hypothetical protein